jgi:hypothetical protein
MPHRRSFCFQSQNTGDKYGTDLSQNTGDKHRTDLSQNTGDQRGTDLGQNTGDKHGTSSKFRFKSISVQCISPIFTFKSGVTTDASSSFVLFSLPFSFELK